MLPQLIYLARLSVSKTFYISVTIELVLNVEVQN